MKKKIEFDFDKVLVIIMFLLILIVIVVSAVSALQPQNLAKNLGGDVTVDLPEDTKLEEITWKDDSLWYLTRPMRDNEEAEVHTFQQSSNFGVFEGTVTVIEHKSQSN